MQSHLERARGEKFKGRDGTLGEGRDESAGGWGECGGVGKGGKGKGGGEAGTLKTSHLISSLTFLQPAHFFEKRDSRAQSTILRSCRAVLLLASRSFQHSWARAASRPRVLDSDT